MADDRTSGTYEKQRASLFSRDRVSKTLLIVAPALLLPFLVLYQGDFNPAQRDFAVLYTGGQTVLTEPAALFNVEKHTKKTADLAARNGVNLEGSTTPWLYPATTAWLYAPFTLLSFTRAFWTMTALNLIALIFCLHIMADFLDARNCRFLGLCALATPAITGTLLHGQTAIFTVLLITLAIREKSDSRGGLWVGLLAFKPVLVLQMMGWLAIKRRWRALAIAIGISAALALASIATSGITGLTDHLALLRAVGSHSLNAAEIVSQPTLAGLTMVLGLGWIGWAALAIPVGIGVVVSRNRPDFDSIALLGSILVAPYLHNTEAGMVALLIVAGFAARGTSRIVGFGLILAAGWVTGISLLASVAMLSAGFLYVTFQPSTWKSAEAPGHPTE